jgi:activator of HSP90 ATPase
MSKIVQQTVTLPARAEALYAMYLDPVQHETFTGGGPVRIAAAPGSEWSAFDGRIYGRVLGLTPGRQIVQSWRSFEWQEGDLDSILILTFWPEGSDTRVELTHVNVPERLYETLVAGWPVRYWEPWRAYVKRGG